MMHDWGWSPWMGGWMMGIGLIWLTTVLVIVALAVFTLRSLLAHRANRTALDLVGQAYARGEIKREEYLQKRADLLGR